MAKRSLIRIALGLTASAILVTGCGLFRRGAEQQPLPPAGTTCKDLDTSAEMTLAEAIAIAASSDCVSEGGLKETSICNDYTGTWWIDVDSDRPGCNPACVVDVNSGGAEINWRCTGLSLPEDTEAAPRDEAYVGWASYNNSEYEFTFRYPPHWTLEEDPNFLRLRNGTNHLDVWFMRAMESRQIGPGGAHRGDFEERGAVVLMGEPVPRAALVFEGRDKGIFYGGPGSVQREELLLAIYLADEGGPGASYDLIELAADIQSEADHIVESFERLPAD